MPTIPAKHVDRLLENLQAVLDLVAIHGKLTGSKPGRRRDVDVLNSSGIVLLIACWESFVEDAAVSAFDFMLVHATGPAVFPTKVLALASSDLRGDKDERRVWELAGDGWRTVMKAHRHQVLARLVDGFHTPRPQQIDALFGDLIGLKDLTSQWNYAAVKAPTACTKLNALVDLRGQIAHKVRAHPTVQKRAVERGMEFIQALAAVSSNRVRDFVLLRTGHEPWGVVSYGGAA